MGFVHDQDHPRPQGCDIPVVVFQGGDGGVVRAGDGIQGFAALDRVTLDRGTGTDASRFGGGGLRPGRVL